MLYIVSNTNNIIQNFVGTWMVDFFSTMDSEDYDTDSVYIKGIVHIQC